MYTNTNTNGKLRFTLGKMNLRFGKAPAAYAAGTPSVVAETNSYGITSYNTDLNY
jgi:hypothetical protein